MVASGIFFPLALLICLDKSPPNYNCYTICIIHNDAKLSGLSLEYFSESYNIGMVEAFEYFGFSEGLSSFFIIHFRYINLLDDAFRLLTVIPYPFGTPLNRPSHKSLLPEI